jgi:HSP20 family molecular chaperone IbpA
MTNLNATFQVTTDEAARLLTVQARHEETTSGRKARREYYRQCSIPRDVDLRTIVSKLSKSGILVVHAPLTEERAALEGVGNMDVPIVIKNAEDR